MFYQILGQGTPTEKEGSVQLTTSLVTKVTNIINKKELGPML
jgi:hypothetical protein